MSDLAPGVYINEVSSASQPISGVGTSTAGFIGARSDATSSNASDVSIPAKLITNWSEFIKNFASDGENPLTDNNIKVLANAIYGFFNNGGTRCWIAGVPKLDQDNVKKALISFQAIDEIAIVAVPLPFESSKTSSEEPSKTSSEQKPATKQGISLEERKGIYEAVLDHCEKMGDRFAILDGFDGNISTQNLTADSIYGGKQSNYGAIYFPYLKVDSGEFMPPSGHVAGIYSRVDSGRGIHKAPANEVIRGIKEVNSLVDKNKQADLNKNGINIIRKFNSDIKVWGARTAKKDEQEYKYINVRRTMLFLRESIDEGTQWAVFEPNNPALWQKIKRNVSDFLTTQWRAGALFGETVQEAFYVKCDAETNPPEEREQGRVKAIVGVALVKPAEFVIFNISQFTSPN